MPSWVLRRRKKRWRLPRRKLCLFVDSACLLASASHMNIFPNVTRPQLRAKNQHYSDEATSSSPLVWWPAVQRRGKRRQDSTGRRRVYCILHACLRIVVISRIKLSCLMPFCPLPPLPRPHCTVAARFAAAVFWVHALCVPYRHYHHYCHANIFSI